MEALLDASRYLHRINVSVVGDMLQVKLDGKACCGMLLRDPSLEADSEGEPCTLVGRCLGCGVHLGEEDEGTLCEQTRCTKMRCATCSEDCDEWWCDEHTDPP